jgi:Tfp pilus assembly protein PilF
LITRVTIAFVALIFVLAAGCSGTQRPLDEEQIQASDFHYQLAIGHWQSNEGPVAIRELNSSLEINPDNEQALFLLGFIYQGRRQYAETERLYRHALLVRPEWHEVMNNLGVVMLEQERWAEAEELYRDLTNMPTYVTPGHAFNNLGMALVEQRRLPDALENFELAIMFQPEHCLAHNNRGMVLEELGNFRAAVGAYDDAIELCGEYQEPHYRLPLLLLRLDREPERAIELLMTCVELGEDTPFGLRCQEYVAPDEW